MAYCNREALFTCELFKCRIIKLVQLTESLNKFSFFNIPEFEWCPGFAVTES